MKATIAAVLRALTNTRPPATVRPVPRNVRRAPRVTPAPVAGVLTLITCHWCAVTTQRTEASYRRCPRCGFVV